MGFGQVGIQFQGALGKSARFFTTDRRSFELMRDPALQLRVARERQCILWVEFDGAFKKLLALFKSPKILIRALEIAGLNKGKVCLTILRRFPLKAALFSR